MNFKIFIILFLFNKNGFGQFNKYNLGFEAGPNISWLRGNESIEINTHSKIGLSFGISGQYNLSKLIAIKSCILYAKKGAISEVDIKNPNANNTGTITSKFNYNYLTLPVLIKITLGKKTTYFFNTGPYLGFLCNQKSITQGTNIQRDISDNTSLNKRLDAGILFGIGINKPLNEKTVISFEIRNNTGLYNTSNVKVANNGIITQNSIDFIFGITYKLFK